ncbi:hypothetical protein AAC387_Pa08g2181 [Persea americana]
MEPVTLSRAVPAQLDMSTYSTEPDIGAKMQAVDTSRVAPDVKFLPWSRRPPSIFSIPNFNVIRKDTFLVLTSAKRAKLGHNNADLKHGKDTHSALENGNGKHDPFKIFIGYDPRKDLACKVCRYSILKRTSIPDIVHPIKQPDLREKGRYLRECGSTIDESCYLICLSMN